ncbi:MAG: hypothetical protein RBG1_1C00001G1655 [candidate division Zixibacteria bacterium RBG-1]|nr:MAG: hypothetical protein RBG1_1C00001G1655 [candidate division Zixibacteria bacterium RBG-1]
MASSFEWKDLFVVTTTLIIVAYRYLYLKGRQKQAADWIFAYLWLMIVNIVLCVKSISVSEGMFNKIIFSFLFFISFLLFCDLFRIFLSRVNRKFFVSPVFWAALICGLALLYL